MTIGDTDNTLTCYSYVDFPHLLDEKKSFGTGYVYTTAKFCQNVTKKL